MNIIFATDTAFITHMGVTMLSILANADTDDSIHFYVLSETLPEPEKERILSLRSIHNFEFSHIPVTTTDEIRKISTLHLTKSHIALPSYFRLKIGSLIPDIDRALYLDSDIIVRGSLKELWNMDLQGKTIGAVEEESCTAHQQKEVFGWETYFNSGIILFDLKKWREGDYERRSFDLDPDILKDLTWFDQGVLNYLLNSDLYLLDDKWNFMVHVYEARLRKAGSADMEKPDPVIVHFTTARKPWLFSDTKIPFADEYQKYKQMSPWKDTGRKEWLRHALRYTYRHPLEAALFWLRLAFKTLTEQMG